MDENLKSQLDNISNEIDSRIEKAYGQALESATGKADEMIKGEVTNLVNKFNELNERLDASEVASKNVLRLANLLLLKTDYLMH